MAVKSLYYRCYFKDLPKQYRPFVPLNSKVERLGIESSKNTIDVAVEANGLKDTEVQDLVIFFHGNGNTLADLGHVFNFAKSHRINLASFDYPCFGRSTGVPSEASLVRAVACSNGAAHKFADSWVIDQNRTLRTSGKY